MVRNEWFVSEGVRVIPRVIPHVNPSVNPSVIPIRSTRLVVDCLSESGKSRYG